MGGNDKILGRLDSLLKECESKISRIELRLPEYEEPSESLSQRVAQLLEPEPPAVPAQEAAPPPIIEEPQVAPASDADSKIESQDASLSLEPALEPAPQPTPPAPSMPPMGEAEEKPEKTEKTFQWPALWRWTIPKRCKRPAVGVLLAGAIGVLLWAASGLRATQRIFTLPTDSLKDLTLSPGGGLLSMDLSRGAVVAIRAEDGKARLKDVMSIVVPNAGGLAWGSSGLWIAGGRSGLLYRYASVPNGTGPQRYPQFHRFPTLLSISQDSLVSFDEAGKRIDRYLISQALTGVSLALLGSYPLPVGVVPSGIYESNGNIWLLDQAAPAIRRYEESGSVLRPLDYFDLKPSLGSGARPEGLAVEGGNLWLMDSSSHTLHRFRLSAINWTPLGGSGAGRP